MPIAKQGRHGQENAEFLDRLQIRVRTAAGFSPQPRGSIAPATDAAPQQPIRYGPS